MRKRHVVVLSEEERARQGHKRWTLRLLADRLVALQVVESVSYETVRQALKQTSSSRG